MICEKTLKNGISHETMCDMTEVEKMEEFLKEQRLRWFEYVERMYYKKASVKRKRFVVEGLKKVEKMKRGGSKTHAG